ncbi:MAG: ATP-binding protein [Muribaculaceae bacterium]|nr:ATP-binding protein [Muribaculaceae bacterium]
MKKIIGRKHESRLLTDYLQSGRAEFVVLYGRRRVGKTFLVRELLSKHFVFHVTGLSPVDSEQGADMKDQLLNFFAELKARGFEGKAPATWMEAFGQLRSYLESLDRSQRQVVFIDEMPWMDTPKSGFLVAFEAFWNGWASGCSNLMLVVCGSVTSWIIKKLLKNKGGLHNRITHEMYLAPFTLAECEKLAESNGVKMSRYDYLNAYMVLGGIPYYWLQLQPRLSLAQNIDSLFFASKRAPMNGEFEKLMCSLFKRPENYIKVLMELSKKRGGLSREEIAKAIKKESGGTLSKALENLQDADFITSYEPIKSKGTSYYKLTDLFTLFFLRFVQPGVNTDPSFWSHSLNTPAHNAWAGLSFEAVCGLHLTQIKKALSINGILCNHQSFVTKSSKGAQIDLVLDRADNVVNLCEMKFASTEYTIKSKDEENLLNKVARLKECIPQKKAVHLTMVTTYGIARNVHSSIVQSEVVMNDLFVE